MGPERAVSVVVVDGRLLVVLRHRPGQDYAVLPGGGVEAGETVAEAAVRELGEETSLPAVAGEVLWVRDDGGRPATYVRMVDVRGEPRLGGPEERRASPGNAYRLVWAGPGNLDRLGLRPELLRPLLQQLLTGPTESTPRP